jgi:hypothetical protein
MSEFAFCWIGSWHESKRVARDQALVSRGYCSSFATYREWDTIRLPGKHYRASQRTRRPTASNDGAPVIVQLPL